jgi:phospholipase/carboxylesterase
MAECDRSWIVVVIAAIILGLSGCGESLREINPALTQAYRIPVIRPDGAEDSTLCLVSVPSGYSPDRAWPLLVALHGYGSSAERFHVVWHEAAAVSGFVLLTPQGEDSTREGVGWAWGPCAEEIVRQSVDATMGAVRIDRSRIFLTGFSQGGRLTYEIAMRHPYLFRGIAPVGAARGLPAGDRLRLLSPMRIYIGHGELEPGLEDARRLAAGLRSVGCVVMLQEYAGIGHGLPDSATAELGRILTFLAGDD